MTHAASSTLPLTRRRIWLPLLCAAGLLADTAVAQTSTAPRPATWVSAGLGVGSLESSGALLAGVAHRRGAHYVGLRVAGAASLFEDGFWDLAVLYGRAGISSRTGFFGAAGVAVVDGERCTGLFGRCTDQRAAIGLPLAAGVTWSPATAFGLGLQAFANLNGLQSFGGLVAVVELGRLR